MHNVELRANNNAVNSPRSVALSNGRIGMSIIVKLPFYISHSQFSHEVNAPRNSPRIHCACGIIKANLQYLAGQISAAILDTLSRYVQKP
jgi:hypothetical protein